MGHGLQVIEEIEVGSASKWKLIQLNTTIYIPLTQCSHWDSVYGMWFFITAHTAGIGNLTVTLQGASDPNQATWTDIGAGVTITGGTAADPIQTEIMRSPLVIAVGSAIATLPPYIRFKCVTPAAAVAAIHRIARTVRGLA